MDLATLRKLSPTVNYIEDAFDQLVQCVDDERRDKFIAIIQRFGESVIRLTYRRLDFSDVSREMYDGLGRISEQEHHYLQLKLVDRVEAFHQQIYASLSFLVALLNYASGSKEPRYSVNSNSKFLQQAKDELRYRSAVLDAINLLERSVDFRSKFVDHPQAHQLHDWYTYGDHGDYYVIYFIKHGPEVYYFPDHNPLSPDFRPIVNCGDDFYVAPTPVRTYGAFHTLTQAVLEKLIAGARRLISRRTQLAEEPVAAPTEPEVDG